MIIGLSNCNFNFNLNITVACIGHAGVRARDTAREDSARPGARHRALHVRPHGGVEDAGRDAHQRQGSHTASLGHVHAGDGLLRLGQQRGHPTPAARSRERRERRRATRRRRGARLHTLPHARTVSLNRVAPLRELQSARALRRRHGARHRVRRHRQQGGARRTRAHAQRRRQLRAPGRARRHVARVHSAHGGHLSQGEDAARDAAQDHHGQARRRDGQVRRHHRPGHTRRRRTQHVALAADAQRPDGHERRRRPARLHAVLVLVSARSLPLARLPAHGAHRPQSRAQDAQARVRVERGALRLRLSAAHGGEEGRQEGQGREGRPLHHQQEEQTRRREEDKRQGRGEDGRRTYLLFLFYLFFLK